MTADVRLRAAVWALIAAYAAFCIRDYSLDVLALPDPGHLVMPYGDSWQRLLVIRDWLAGGSFFNHTVPGANAPFGGIETHWTRAVDLMIAALYQFTPSSLPLDTRLLLAAGAYPVLIGVCALAFLERGVGRPRSFQPILCLALLAFFNTETASFFSAGFADHHGTLSMMWCGILALLMKPPGKGRAVAIGAVLGVALWISVESLFTMAFVYAVLGIDALVRPRRAYALALTTATAALVMAMALVIERPHNTLAYDVYDSLSIVHVVLAALCAAAAAVLAVAFQRLPALKSRVIASAAAGGCVLTAMAALFPLFFLGPRAEAASFVFTDFLPTISEDWPLRDYPLSSIFYTLWQPAVAALLLAATWPARRWARDPWKRNVLCAALCATAFATATAVRWTYYVQPAAMLTIALLLPLWAGRTRAFWLHLLPSKHKAWLAVCYMGITLCLIIQQAGRIGFSVFSLCSLNQQYAAQSGQVRALLGEDPGLILLTEPNVSNAIRFYTDYKSIAGNYDREAEGLKDFKTIATAKTAEDARKVLEKRQVGAMLACPSIYTDRSVFPATLGEESGRPEWLEYLGTLRGLKQKDMPPVMLFRVTASSKGKE